MFYLPYLPRAAYNIANNRKHYAGDNQIMNSLKEQRTRRGLSVRQLAAKANVDPSAISQLENDRRKAQQTTLIKLATALEVPPEIFNDLLDTTAAERGRTSQRIQGERKRQQSQTLPVQSPRPTKSRKQPKVDYWVFDDEGTPYGPFAEDSARRLQTKLSDSYICQAGSLTAAGEQYRRDLFARSRGQHPEGFRKSPPAQNQI